jgi:FtsH-binding integral membrane protein
MKNNLSIDALFDFSDLSPSTQNHLRRVYSLLSTGIAVAILCFILAQYFPSFAIFFIGLGVLALFADILLICLNRRTRAGQIVGFTSLYGYASSVGGAFGAYINSLDPNSRMDMYRLMMSALVSVLIIFIMFSVFALLTSNRAGVYFLVIISSLVLSILSFFMWGYSAILSVIVSSLYIVTDTQNIIYRQKTTGSDAIYDAKMLFIDMVKLFSKLLEYFKKKDEDKKKKEK